MVSLAPFLYRNIFADRGGPISGVESSKLPVFDRNSYQAAAFLKRGLADSSGESAGSTTADGIACSDDPAVAEHMAISEALEGWAFRETRRSPGRARYGFCHDRSSNGMAAFPGFKWQARRRARLEALQKFALVSWWDKRVPATSHRAPYPGVGMVRIHHGQNFGEVVILYHRAPTGFVAYGHAAGTSLATATTRAALQLVRSERVISRQRACGSLAQATNYFDRRCLYFSTEEGHREFLDRVESGETKPASSWKTIFDGEIPGPWSQWATVWRHCVEMPTYAFLDTRQNFFFW
jgi:hypothetical protein